MGLYHNQIPIQSNQGYIEMVHNNVTWGG